MYSIKKVSFVISNQKRKLAKISLWCIIIGCEFTFSLYNHTYNTKITSTDGYVIGSLRNYRNDPDIFEMNIFGVNIYIWQCTFPKESLRNSGMTPNKPWNMTNSVKSQQNVMISHKSLLRINYKMTKCPKFEVLEYAIY